MSHHTLIQTIKPIRLFISLFVTCLSLGLSQPVNAELSKSTLELGIGSYYSQGSYGRDNEGRDNGDGNNKTNIAMIPVHLKWKKQRLWLKAASSFVEIDGPGNIDSGEISSSRLDKASGSGDLFLSAGQLFWYAPLWFQINVKYKQPIADEDKGLGTGKADYSLGGDIYWPIGEWTSILSLDGQWRHETESLPLLDRQTLKFGFVRKQTQAFSWGTQFEYRTKSLRESDPKQEVFLFATWRASTQLKISPYAHAGFTDASPDFGLGVSFIFIKNLSKSSLTK